MILLENLRRPMSYDGAASWWHSRLVWMGFDEAYDQLVQKAGPEHRPCARMLEVGCGTAAFSQAWLQHGGMDAGSQIDVLDPSVKMLAQARTVLADAHPTLIEAGVGAELKHGGTYDVILCAHVIEHLDDPLAALSWISAQLRPGGLLLLAVSRPHWCTALIRFRWGTKAWHPNEVHALLSAAGFGSITTTPFVGGVPSRVSCGYLGRRPLDQP